MLSLFIFFTGHLCSNLPATFNDNAFFSALANEKELTNSSTSLDLTNCGSSMDLTNGSTSLDQELSNHLPHIHPKLTKPPKTEHYSLQEINHWQFSLRESYRLFCPYFG